MNAPQATRRGLRTWPFSLVCCGLAICLYGIAGSPTPDNPGLVEAVIGVLLVMAAARGLGRRLRDFRRPENLYIKALHIFMLCGLSLPLVVGAVAGNDPVLIARDIFSFLFLCLPLFVIESLNRCDEARRWLPWLCMFAGAMFAIRTLIPSFHVWIAPDELLYLSNSPLVVFTAVFLCGQIWRLLCGPLGGGAVVRVAFMGAAVLVILAAMLLDVQRATIAAVLVSVGFFWLGSVVRAPRRTVIPSLILAGIALAAWPWLMMAGEAIYAKTATVGLNMRAQELEAVWLRLQGAPWQFLIGTGWGGGFVSPAVDDVMVNYTHSLLSTLFLKGGVVFLGAGVFLCGAAIHQIFLIFQRDSVWGVALFWPFIIPVFLYASHKSLDYGLLLLLIGMWSNAPDALRKPARWCMQKERPPL